MMQVKLPLKIKAWNPGPFFPLQVWPMLAQRHFRDYEDWCRGREGESMSLILGD